MDSERWQQIQILFEQALEKDPSYRITFLKAACADDVALYREVASLLESDQMMNSLVDGHALEALTYAGDAPRAQEPADEAGTEIGPYRLVRRIGEGGMGIVYLAERADGHFEQEVALKLIRRGMDSERIVQRFLSERQILARLQHPNIARLLDGGVAADGRPFFAMEYVEGVPLLAYARSQQLSVDDRLALFESVCAAVQHAHQNLVVHRDLKPGNILVTRAGEVKLLDFGIARALEADAEGGAPVTEAGMRVLTPEYAAPEQIVGGPITTQTDLYALGVVLYELLVGVRPLTLSSHAPAEVEAVIVHQVPDRPSVAAQRNEAFAALYGSEQAERVIRKIEGDLDTICMMALRKEPERRYGSVGDLRSDLERHRAGLPVSAQPDALRYRFEKFAGRHRTSLFALAASIILLASVIGVYTQRLGQERDRAQVEARRADETTRFLVSLFDAANPHVAQGDTLTAIDMLREGAARIETDLAGDPEVQARLLTTVGDAYHGLAYYREAEEAFSAALELIRAEQGIENEDALYLLSEIANIRHSLSDFAAEDSITQITLAIQQELFGEESAPVAATLLQMASNNRSMGRFDVAMPLYERAVAINEKVLPPDDPELAWSINNYGWAYHSQGFHEEAEVQYQKAVAIQREHLGNDHPDLAFTLNNLGGLLWSTGRMEEGEAIVRESLEIRRNLYGEEHPEYIQSLNNLAGLLFRKGEYEEAERHYRTTLEVNRRMLGDTHRYVASGLGSMATLARTRGAYDEALPYQQEALDIYLQVFGEDHASTANAQAILGLIHWHLGDAEAAEAASQQALAFWRRQERPRVQMAIPLQTLAMVRLDAGQAETAEPLLREALALRTAELDEGDVALAETRGALGRALTLQGQAEEGRRLLVEAQAAYETAGRTDAEMAQRVAGWMTEVP